MSCKIQIEIHQFWLTSSCSGSDSGCMNHEPRGWFPQHAALDPPLVVSQVMLSDFQLSARIATNVSTTGYNSCRMEAACCFLQGDRVRSGPTRWRHVAQTDPWSGNYRWKHDTYNIEESARKRTTVSPVYLSICYSVQYSACSFLLSMWDRVLCISWSAPKRTAQPHILTTTARAMLMFLSVFCA